MQRANGTKDFWDWKQELINNGYFDQDKASKTRQFCGGWQKLAIHEKGVAIYRKFTKLTKRII